MYTMIAVGMLTAGILMIITSLVLMVVWRVPDLIDELTGKKAKRQIKALRDANIGTGAFDRMSTGDITDMAKQEFKRLKTPIEKPEGVVERNTYEAHEVSIKNRSLDSGELEEIKEQSEPRVEKDSRVKDMGQNSDRVAEAKWVLLEEASSIFLQEV